MDRIKIARTTNRSINITTEGSFKLTLRGNAIDWLNNIRDTLDVDISTWTNIEFVKHFSLTLITIVWDLTKLKHEERDKSSDLMLIV